MSSRFSVSLPVVPIYCGAPELGSDIKSCSVILGG